MTGVDNRYNISFDSVLLLVFYFDPDMCAQLDLIFFEHLIANEYIHVCTPKVDEE
jgi:hypothetical protein